MASDNGSTPSTTLDPPFRGYIETTFDALLVFEAARRGMIPRVTRRLIERERSMVQSGAVFVFDEHESGIKRWTDGLIWSPSRILGNFLVYRQTDKPSVGKPVTPSINQDISPSGSSSSSTPKNRNSDTVPSASIGLSDSAGPSKRNTIDDSNPLGQGQLHRPRSASEGNGVDRARERQLVGSLTSSYKFTSGGLVKKTMSVIVNDYAQHMISYYTLEDALAGRLRTPSSIPELAALEIAPEYLVGQTFRFPPRIEVGPDGKPRYRGEPDVPNSPQSPTGGVPLQSFPSGEYYDPYQNVPPQIRMDNQSRNRPEPVPHLMPTPMLPDPNGYNASPGTGYYDHPSQQAGMSSINPGPAPIIRQGSNSSLHGMQSSPNSAPPSVIPRPGSSSRRYDPYATSPRLPGSGAGAGALQVHMGSTGQGQGGQHRRQSQPQPIPASPGSYYSSQQGQGQGYDIKPSIAAGSGSSYNYQPPSTAPGSFASFQTSHSHPQSQPYPQGPPHHSPYQQQHQQHHQPQPQQQHPQHQQYTSSWSHPAPPPHSSRVTSGSGSGLVHGHGHGQGQIQGIEYQAPSSSGSGSSGAGVTENWANQVSPTQLWEGGMVGPVYGGTGNGVHGDWRGGG